METWVENDVAMSNGNGSSHAENIVGLWLPYGTMEKKLLDDNPKLVIKSRW